MLNMRHVLALLVGFAAPGVGIAAPAPVYKGWPTLESAHMALPVELRDSIQGPLDALPDHIEETQQMANTHPDPKVRAKFALSVEKLKGKRYSHPVEVLEFWRKQGKYRGTEDEAKIKLALKLYRKRFERAQKQGLVK